MKFNYLKLSMIGLAIATSLISCKKDNDDNNIDKSKSDFVNNYVNIVSANYDDAYNTAVKMQTAINAFVASPSDATMKAAKDAWLYTRNFYGQTEAFRQANGPIDNPKLLNTEEIINPWPLDESYIDYVNNNGTISNNGLISQDGKEGRKSFKITAENLIAKNTIGGEENIATGWHAIEFLLWGQDLNSPPGNPKLHNDYNNHGGTRPFTDYTTADFAARRIKYLTVVTDLLIKELKDLNTTWAKNGSYRATFLALDEKVQLTNILNGIGYISNGEVAIERIDAPIDEGQEQEQSCFSDNTKQDFWANVNGINNVITGKYTRDDKTVISGTSLIELVSTINPKTSDLLKNTAENTLAKLNALLNINENFDQIISEESLGSNGPAGQLSTALKTQGTVISDAAKALSVSINIK